MSHSGLQALLESARLLNASATLDELLSHLMRTVMGRLLVTRGVVAIEDNGEMRVALARGVSAIAKGSILTGDLAAGAKLELQYPIGTAEGPVGLLVLSKPALGSPNPEQLELLQALLELAAIAIAKARAHEHTVQVNRSLDQSLQELRAIVDLARGLAAKTDAGEVAHLLALTLAGRWTVRKHAVAAWKGGHATTVRQRGILLPELAVLRSVAAGLSEPAYTAETLPADSQAVLQLEPGAILFPIRAGEDAIGVVICGPRMAGRAYQRSDVEFGAGLIAQAAVAFENAWRLEKSCGANPAAPADRAGTRYCGQHSGELVPGDPTRFDWVRHCGTQSPGAPGRRRLLRCAPPGRYTRSPSALRGGHLR
ncbi:MAG: hypothetical protein WDO73_05235 [Ignavibacteriota bacterium]